MVNNVTANRTLFHGNWKNLIWSNCSGRPFSFSFFFLKDPGHSSRHILISREQITVLRQWHSVGACHRRPKLVPLLNKLNYSGRPIFARNRNKYCNKIGFRSFSRFIKLFFSYQKLTLFWFCEPYYRFNICLLVRPQHCKPKLYVFHVVIPTPEFRPNSFN